MLTMMMIMGLVTNICSGEKVFNFGGNWKVFHIGSKLHHLLNVLLLTACSSTAPTNFYILLLNVSVLGSRQKQTRRSVKYVVHLSAMQ